MKFITILIVFYAAQAYSNVPNEFKSWNQMDFKFPSNAIREKAISDGYFNAANVIPIDVQPDYRGEKNLIEK